MKIMYTFFQKAGLVETPKNKKNRLKRIIITVESVGSVIKILRLFTVLGYPSEKFTKDTHPLY